MPLPICSFTPPAASGRRYLRSVVGLLLVQREDEERSEGQVDEVHGLHQTHGEEHDRHEAALRLGLACNAVDGCATGKAVTDGGTDGATAHQQTTADHGACQLRGLSC
jgi:hypothetical protein